MPEMVDESTVRAVLEQMKKLNLTRAMIVTSSGFTRTAIDFSDSRPIELINKDQLQELLGTVDIYGSMRRT
jgi:HJR/Mrr/RecB family endonuclease